MTIDRGQRLLKVAMAFALLGVVHIPFSNMGGVGFDLYLNIALMLLAVPAVFLVFSLYCKDRRRISGSPLIIAFLLFALVLSVPLFYATDLSESVFRVLAVWFAVFFLVVLTNSRAITIDFWLFLIVSSALIQSGLGLFQVFYLYGQDFYFVVSDGRPVGTFYQVNVLSSYVATGLVCAAVLVQRANSRMMVVSSYCLAVIAPVVLFLIMSRAGFIGAALGLLVIGLSQRAEVRLGSRLKKDWWWALLLGILVGLAIVVYRYSVGEGPRSIDTVTQAGRRLQNFEHVIWMIMQKPLAGWGYGSFDHAFLSSWFERFQYTESIPVVSHQLGHPHNEFLYWVVEGGVLIGFAILALIIYLLRTFVRNFSLQRLAMFGTIVPLSVHLMLELPFYHSFAHLLIFILLVFLIFGQASSDFAIERGRQGMGLLSVIMVVFSIVVFSTGFHTLKRINTYKRTFDVGDPGLSRIINPFLHTSDIDLAINNANLKNAMWMGGRELIDKTIKESEIYYNQTPYLETYADVLAAQYIIGEHDVAQSKFEKGKVLYGTAKIFRDNDTLEDFMADYSQPD